MDNVMDKGFRELETQELISVDGGGVIRQIGDVVVQSIMLPYTIVKATEVRVRDYYGRCEMRTGTCIF